MRSLGLDLLVARHEELHDAPAYEVGHTADTEHDEVTRRLTGEAEKRHIGLSRIVKENTGEVVDQERTDTSGHTADTDDGSDGRLGEHITYY